MAANATIGALKVDLGLSSAQFQTGLKQAQGQLAAFGTRMAAVGKQISSAFAAAGIGVGVVGLGQLASAVRNATKGLSDLANAAGRAGIGVEGLQVFRKLASQIGIGAEQADSALAKLTTKIGQAAVAAGGPAAKAFDQLGISIRDTAGNARPTDAVLGDVMDRIARIKDRASQSAVAASLFGDELGPKLVAVLARGRGALADTEQAMRDLGTLMTGDMVRAGDTLNRKFDELAERADAFWKGLVVGSAEAVASVAANMAELGKQAKDGNWAEFFFGKSPALDQFLSGLRGADIADPNAATTETTAQLLTALGLSKPQTPTARPAMLPTIAAPKLSEAMKPLADNLQTVQESLGQAADNIADTWGEAARSIGDSFADAFAGMIDGTRSLGDAVGDLLKDFGRLALNSAFQSLFGNVLGGLFGGGAVGAPMNILPNLAKHAAGGSFRIG